MKVGEVLSDEEAVNEIIERIGTSESESRLLYKANRKKRSTTGKSGSYP